MPGICAAKARPSTITSSRASITAWRHASAPRGRLDARALRGPRREWMPVPLSFPVIDHEEEANDVIEDPDTPPVHRDERNGAGIAADRHAGEGGNGEDRAACRQRWLHHRRVG